ncbi:MAG: hypothetical protein V1827_06615 [Candidatus Micrarchaeota archaeon]
MGSNDQAMEAVIQRKLVEGSIRQLRDRLNLKLTSFRPKTTEPQDILKCRVDALKKEKRYEEARNILKEALSENLMSAFAIRELISLLPRERDLPEAEALFDYAHVRGIMTRGIYSAMIQVYGKNMKRAEADTVFALARDQGMLSADLYHNYLKSFFYTGKAEDATALFNDACATGNANPRIFTRTISILQHHGQIDLAVGFFNEHRHQYGSRSSYRILSNLLCKQKRYKEADENAHEALERGMADPKFVSILMKIEEDYYSVDSCIALYLHAAKKRVCDEELHHLALRILSRYKRLDEADSAFSDIVQRGEDTSGLYLHMVRSHFKNCRYVDALNWFEWGSEFDRLDASDVSRFFEGLYARNRFHFILAFADLLSPKLAQDPVVVLHVADAMRKERMPGRAIELIDILLSRADVPPESARRAEAIRAFCLKENGRRNEAFSSLLALKEAPENPLYTPRIACGIVFCWQEMGFPSDIDKSHIDWAYGMLQKYQPTAHWRLREDITNAMRIIDDNRS